MKRQTAAESLCDALAQSKAPHDLLQKALRLAVDRGIIPGFLLAIYNHDPKASWRAKPSDILSTIHTLTEALTGSSKLADEVIEHLASNIHVPAEELN